MSSANFYTGYNPEKPTSKVLAPPGGKSNDIFGFGDHPAPRPQSQHGFNAQETAQNKVNQISFLENQHDNQHYKKMNNTSSILFGDDSTPVNQPSRYQQHDRQKSSIFDDHSSNNGNGNHDNANGRTGKAMQGNARTGTFNPITGQAYDEAPQKSVVVAPEPEPQQPAPEPVKTIEEPAVVKPPPHTSSRVLQPPGGRSTALW